MALKGQENRKHFGEGTGAKRKGNGTGRQDGRVKKVQDDRQGWRSPWGAYVVPGKRELGARGREYSEVWERHGRNGEVIAVRGQAVLL